MNITDAVARKIETYRPRCLSNRAWTLARGAVTTLITDASPTTVIDASMLASTLCAFLATPCGWLRDGAPDLRALLADAAIEQFAARFRGATRTRQNHVGRLRQLQRVLAGTTAVPAQPELRGRRAASEVARAYAPCRTSSVATLAAVFAGYTGTPLTEGGLRGLVESLVDASQATVMARWVGTVLLDRATLGYYLGAADLHPRTEVVRASSPRTKIPKALSQRQQLARDRADRDAYRRAQGGPRLAAHPGLDALDPVIGAAIATYRPQVIDDATWAILRPLTMRMVVGYGPPSVVAARNAATIVVAFLRWVWSLPNRPDPTSPPSALELLSSPLVEAYAAPGIGVMQRRGTPTASASTNRSVLRRCVRSLDSDSVGAPFTYSAIAPPYTPAECEDFVWLATSQPTPSKERHACYLLGLSLGAGLSSQDLRGVRRSHIAELLHPDHRAHLAVTVTADRGTRTVPIRVQYEPLIRRALELSADRPADELVLGRKESRRHVTVGARREIVTATPGQVITIEPNRLRTTWLFACMNAAVPLADLLQLAGLRSARSLADLLPMCPPHDPAAIALLVAQVRDAEPAPGCGGSR